MTGFLRVKAADGPTDEFYAPEQWVAKHPDRYQVLDKTPVEVSPAVIKTTAKPTGSRSKSVGNTTKEES